MIIVLLIASPVLGKEDEDLNSPKSYQSKTTESNPNSAFSLDITFGRKQEDNTDWSSPKCDHPQSHDEADLCEQRRMSKAADDAVYLNGVQTGIGAAGAVLVLATFALTVWGTRASVNAADAAIRSAVTAERIARDIERPYIFVGEMAADTVISVDNNGFFSGAVGTAVNCIEFECVFQNHGRTPAVLYEFCCEVDFIKFGNDAREIYKPPTIPTYPSTKRIIVEVISPGNGTTKQSFTIPARDAFGPFQNIPLIYGYSSYRDITGRRYRSDFGYLWIGSKFSPYGDGYNYDRELTEEETPPAPVTADKTSRSPS